MNRDLFYTAYNAYLNGMIKQAWGGNFAARRAQNAYSRGNQAMGNRLMNRAYRRGYPMGGYGQQQQPMPQQPQQNQWQPAPYPDDSHLLKPTGEVDMYGRPLQIANLD